MTHNLAVFDSTDAYFVGKKQAYRRPLPLAPTSLRAIAEDALSMGVDTVWMLPGSRASLLAGNYPRLYTEENRNMECRASTTRRGLPTWINTWRRTGTYEEKQTIRIAFPEHDPRWGWQTISEPRTLLKAVLSLEQALQHPVEWSPGHTARSLMEEKNKGREAWIQAAALPDIVCSHMAQNLMYKLAIAPADYGKSLHIYDKNSMYLGACTSANLGEGTPVHVDASYSFNPKIPGLWAVKTLENGIEWFWTPEMEYIIKHDYNRVLCGLQEAWIWPTYHQTLRSWGEHLWASRASLKALRDEHPNYASYSHAYDAIKAIATQGLGWLAHKPEKGDSSQWFRPDWWSMIVSTARVKMLYKIEQMDKQGYKAVWCDVDELGFVSTDANPATAIPGMLSHRDNLGGFKHKTSHQIDEGLIGLFSDAVSLSVTRKGLLARKAVLI